MNKERSVYLTFDIETIVSRLSRTSSYFGNVYAGAMYMAHELKKRNQNATFFISLSPKQPEVAYKAYEDCLDLLINSLRAYDNIRLAPHLHAFNLPVSFPTASDSFSDYSLEQQVEMLAWAKDFFAQRGISTDWFRPGGYKINESYYEALEKTGYTVSSILERDKTPTINLSSGELNPNEIYDVSDGLREYPVTSLLIKSIKLGKEELVNLSPDFFTIESMSPYLEKLDYINVNYHSFSVFSNRLLRENHAGQFWKNLKFLTLERTVMRALSKMDFELINRHTTLRNELVSWLDWFEEKNYITKFLGE